MPEQPEWRNVDERYAIERKLGEGASAETFVANDRENDDRRVVIKSLHVEKLDGWKFFELFEREARTLSGLDHGGVPNFIEWFASKGDDGRPRFHIVQQFIEGRPLSNVIDDGGMSQAEFDQLALGMLDILHYLHGRTPPVYHRDIKPSNIIIGEMGAPVLIDFGSVTSGWRAEDERGSTVAGTHGYMPPEQYVGQVSPRSDLYGLGATLLHVLTGRDPGDFSFDDGRINVPEDLDVRPSVRTALDAMLEPAPRDRPQNAKEARALFLSDEPVTSTAMVVAGRSTALSVVDENDGIVRLQDADSTRFVDLGPPPRDPSGPFQDVYRSLCSPWYSMSIGNEGVNRMPARMSQTAQLILYLILLPLMFGMWPLIRLVGRKDRMTRDRLFRTGLFAPAVVVGVAAHNQMSSRVTFEFEVGGKRMQASSLVVSADAGHMLAGQTYGVLYEDGNPQVNTIVYR